jgi:hypothetical protein
MNMVHSSIQVQEQERKGRYRSLCVYFTLWSITFEKEIDLLMVPKQTARERFNEMKKGQKTQIWLPKETMGMRTCRKERRTQVRPQIPKHVSFDDDMDVKP